jgi:peptide/nickel transport system permease protein
VITTIGAVLGYLLGGNLLVEQLFSWPGIGQYSWVALTYKDIDALQGCIIVYSVIYIALNVLVDIAYSLIDPRIRLAS